MSHPVFLISDVHICGLANNASEKCRAPVALIRKRLIKSCDLYVQRKWYRILSTNSHVKRYDESSVCDCVGWLIYRIDNQTSYSKRWSFYKIFVDKISGDRRSFQKKRIAINKDVIISDDNQNIVTKNNKNAVNVKYIVVLPKITT